MWLFPEFTFSGTRNEIESGIKDLYGSIVSIGESAEFDLLGDYRHNKWRNEQKKRNESGFYRDSDGLKYYNALQDKEYYQLPSGKWQEIGKFNTPIDDPFEKSVWRSIANITEINGSWIGTNKINIPEVKNLNPAFTVIFTMTLRNRNDLIDIGFKLDMENYLESVLLAYPGYFDSKETIWNKFVEGSNQSIDFGEFYIGMYDEQIPLENIINECIIQINNEGTKIKAIIPQNIFGINGTDNLECILEKE
jgi:hypothetical protein